MIKTATKTVPKSAAPNVTNTTTEDVISYSPVKLIDEVILRAYSEKASDIHIEPLEHECRVRVRLDGNLVYLGRYKKEIHEEAVARLKVLSSLRTDVRMSPQDGRFKVIVTGVSVSVRLSIVPSFYGEKCVLRLLPQSSHMHTLESLGFVSGEIEKIHESLASPHGMILVVGQTGSGKTTTLYALLQKIARPDVSIVSLEDPIEYSISGITQIPIHAGSGGNMAGSNGSMTFASALRAVVRQDPDIIMVGEIRDSITAELATHVSLTGHLLLSTLHTNDAVTTLPRLIDMGVEPFLVASTVRAIISQRLVRRICQKCKVEEPITKSQVEFLERRGVSLSLMPKSLTRGHGCLHCRNSGYSGRTVISEILQMSEKMRELVMQKAQTEELAKCAIENGMTVLFKNAIEKVINGTTTLDEITTIC